MLPYFDKYYITKAISSSSFLCCDSHGLTHGCGEDDNSQYVHAFAGTGNDFILDVGCRGDLQEDWVAQFRVVVVGHDIYVVCLGLFDVSTLDYRNQVSSILEQNERQERRRLLICGQ